MKKYDQYNDPWFVLFGDYNQDREAELYKYGYSYEDSQTKAEGKRKRYQEKDKVHVCVMCGKEYITHNYKRRTCSKECAKAKRDMMLHQRKAICVVCGKEFSKNTMSQKMCGKECMYKRKKECDNKYNAYYRAL